MVTKLLNILAILETPSKRAASESREALDKHVFIAGSTSSRVVLKSARFDVQLYCRGNFRGAFHGHADDSLSAKVVKLVQGYRGILNQKAGRNEG